MKIVAVNIKKENKKRIPIFVVVIGREGRSEVEGVVDGQGGSALRRRKLPGPNQPTETEAEAHARNGRRERDGRHLPGRGDDEGHVDVVGGVAPLTTSLDVAATNRRPMGTHDRLDTIERRSTPPLRMHRRRRKEHEEQERGNFAKSHENLHREICGK